MEEENTSEKLFELMVDFGHRHHWKTSDKIKELVKNGLRLTEAHQAEFQKKIEHYEERRDEERSGDMDSYFENDKWVD